MNLSLIGHNYRYELEKLVRIFFPFEKIVFTNQVCTTDNSANTVLRKAEDKTLLTAELFLDGKHKIISSEINNKNQNYFKQCELELAVLLYDCFTEITSYHPEWGILTGVRPAKLYSRLCASEGKTNADKYFESVLKVSQNKISLCSQAIDCESKIIELSRSNSFSLYISIPFCPTRCSYCSFVSHSIDKAKNLIPSYVDLLCRELEITARKVKQFSLRLETIYIGGGTPTSLNAIQLEKIMKTVSNNFDLKNLREYTVEAGRPDTITEEKLHAIIKNGATRISINPQTMNDSVLEVIGRKHTAKQTIEAYNLARDCGIKNINMDLIAGLPTDTLESFKATVKNVIELNPESVTVHALSMKRSSTLTTNGNLPEIDEGTIASEMVNYARKELTKANILPYYMYRQSKTVGNLENVGYAKKGYECLYNVYIMDETHTIVACGASAVTKLREPCGQYIERIFNYKYPYEYINKFNDLMERKDGITAFYEKYNTAD